MGTKFQRSEFQKSIPNLVLNWESNSIFNQWQLESSILITSSDESGDVLTLRETLPLTSSHVIWTMNPNHTFDEPDQGGECVVPSHAQLN